MRSDLYKYVCLIGLCLLLIHPVRSQHLAIKLNKGTLADIFSEIEKQANVHFNYDAGEINLRKRYDFVHKGSLTGALNDLANTAELTFRLEGNRILVRTASRRLVNGTVTDKESGEILPGVTVRISNGKVLAITDLSGKFSGVITANDLSKTQLEFKMVGMKTFVSSPLGDRNVVNVALETDFQQMDEVVVTNAYTNGTPKEEVVGSISQITAKQLQVNRPIESLDKMLEGLAAGVYVEPSTGLGTPVKINIRGQGTLTPIGSGRTTSTQPLFVIDGIPVQEQKVGDATGNFNGETLLNPIAGINPQDIASISILKDASATTIYGANAANGVIIITTKSGREGKTTANIAYSSGVSTFINRMKLLSGPQYYVLKKEALLNDGFTESQAAQQAGSATQNTDWLGLTNRNATYNNINADLSGGKNGLTYRFSTGYRNQQGGSIGNNLQQMNLSLKVNNIVSEKFKFGITLSPSLLVKNGLDNYENDAYLPPNLAPYDAEGNFTELLRIPNPLAVLAQNEDKSNKLAFNGNANLHYSVTPDLTISGTIGTNYLQGKQTIYKSAKNATGNSTNGNLKIFDRQTFGWLGYLQGNYNKTFSGKHSVNILAGYEVKDEKTVLLGGSGLGFSYDRIRELSQATTRTSFSSKQEDATISYYGQAGYDFAKKYFLTASIRSDQSSIFGNDRQVAINSAVGLGWILSKEAFLQENKTLTFLKLRASYGSTGNSRIGSYAARGLYNFSYGNYNGEVAAIPDGAAAPNPDLGWEKNFKLNTGLDVTFFDKISLTVEYYNHTIRDLISNIAVPQETGFTTISANTGTMRNEGLDLSVQTVFFEKQDFNWRSVFVMGINKNKILKYNNGLTTLYASTESTTGEPNVATKEGYSTSAIWGVKWAGVNPETGQEQFYAPDGSIVDRTTIRTYPASSWIKLGDGLPKAQGSWINTLSYKNFSMTLNILYSLGESFMQSTKYYADGLNLQNTNMNINLIDRWQKAGDIAPVSKLSIEKRLVKNSSRYLHDLTNIKLSNVTLNFQLPKTITQSLKMKQMSAYLNATNLAYWYKEKSPEGRNGIREIRFTTPETRTITIGINIGI